MFLIFWNFEIQSPRSIDIAYFAAMHHLNFCTCKIKLSTETPKSTYRTSWFDKKVQSILVDRPAPNTFYVVGPLNFFLEKKLENWTRITLCACHLGFEGLKALSALCCI